MNDFASLLLSYIPSAKPASGQKEIVCRCFYCPDSRDMSHGHFYIKVPQHDDDISVCNCFKCGFKSLVTSQRLIEWGIYDSNLLIEVASRYERNKNNPRYKKFYTNIIFNLHNRHIRNHNMSYIKLKYINERLGLDLTFKDLLDNKIVLNIGDVLDSNNIIKFTRYDNIMKELDESFLGFISYDNGYINLRNLKEGMVSKSIDKKYINYNVFDNEDSAHKFYVIPNDINLLDQNRVQIHIGEGSFDALSIKYNVVQNNYNNIFSASTGKGYGRLMKFFVNEIGIINPDFHLYVDNDVDRNFIIKSSIEYMNIDLPVYIHRNIYPGQKDIGVRKEFIKESIERIN